MVGLILVAAALAGWWGWRTRDARALRWGDVAAVVAALVALRLMTRGQELPGLVALGGAAWWLWFRQDGEITWRRRMPRNERATPMSRERASALLDVPLSASPAEVRAAHRRLVARVHPDAGGSADLTAQVNAARDALLRR